uniref:Uncharacterized protein n=1 Tax=Meloidogyne enterolobii TaxID=390850 RepID=A0A6V7UCW0_MELEN|nr:unnamed protein product [Meloidogyne enterolobii]
MYLLPPEIQLDIFKFFNFEQLSNIQQTNFYLSNFFKEYADKLARKKFYGLRDVCIDKSNLNQYNFYTPKPELYDLQLSKELENMWKCGIEESIPMFLGEDDTTIKFVACIIKESHDFEPVACYAEIYLRFPNIPKTIEEMKIARYLLKLLFNSFFGFVQFNEIIFNPKMIQLLFDENKTNIPLQIHSRIAYLSVYNKFDDCLLKFILNHLNSNGLDATLDQDSNMEQCINNLFKLLTIGGNKLPYVCYEFVVPKLCNLIIQHIETSKDLSKMVKEIRFYCVVGDLMTSERAENIERGEDIDYIP